MNERPMKKLKTWEKLFIIFGFLLIVITVPIEISNYFDLMENRNMVKGVITRIDLSSGSNKYLTINYNYKVTEVEYKETIKDNSPLSSDYQEGDTLFVYYDKRDPQLSMALKKPISQDTQPSLWHYMRHDSRGGYILWLICILILRYTLPVVIAICYMIIGGLFLIIFKKSRFSDFVKARYLGIMNMTINRITIFFKKW